MNSEILNKAYAILVKRGSLSCSELGWALWGTTTSSLKGSGVHLNNKFCRPAGKVLKELEARKMASHFRHKNKIIWKALSLGGVYGRDLVVDNFMH